MAADKLVIEIGGAEVPDLAHDLISLEVELDDQLTGMFRLSIALLLKADGSWPYLDDDRFAVWSTVSITAGTQDDSQQLISGYITHVRPEFGPGLEQCRLVVWGMDAGVLMDRVDVVKAWPNMRDSDIATELFQQAGLTPKVTDTDVVHDDKIATIMQRETDMRLLKRLALRNGYECFVDGDTGYFQPPDLGDAGQAVLNVHAGDQTNVNRFSLEVNALTPAEVAMSDVDRLTGAVLTATAEAGHLAALGAKRPADLLPAGIDPGQIVVGQPVATGAPELAAFCQAVFDQHEWFVTGEGEVAANQYNAILLPRRTVTINGIGETHSGSYYVTHVTHRFSDDGYVQRFRVKRNALVSGGGGLSGLL
ncbi:phage late control D family protein [Kutzneria chonburiensis]|uniref:Phage late control D family protein n=1 Tax=Kutzneria chonburiensis TaxID=1483604 RepID=A0ABV6MNS6_9PSEU|nr:contractile injection system protein, VgrG/Pvc8 family [Kutzneria chonburiensis]